MLFSQSGSMSKLALVDYQEDDEDDEEYQAIYEPLWDAIGMPADKDAQGKPIPAPRIVKYKIDDFTFLKVLGKGSFGKVILQPSSVLSKFNLSLLIPSGAYPSS